MNDAPHAHWLLADWLEHAQRQHWRSIDMSLDRIARVWEHMRGARSPLVISVAGTNGKGSCVAMLEAAWLEANGGGSASSGPLTIGAYTSPYLLRYNERIRINGRAAQDATLCSAFAEVEQARDGIPLTYFEFGTLCALRVFQRARVDVAILEAGMGGRLDAINLIDNDIALLTAIGIDHAEWLGSTREAIGREKAGLLKAGAVAVCADPNPPKSIARVAADIGCGLLLNGRDYQLAPDSAGNDWSWRSRHPLIAADWRRLDGLRPPPGGARQLDNLGGAVATLALAVSKSGAFTAINQHNLIHGLAKARLTGRCQVIAGCPEIILDVAHNPDSAAELASFLANRPRLDGITHGVLGALADKAVTAMMAALATRMDRWYLATLDGERGQTGHALQRRLARVAGDCPASTHDSPLAAYSAALAAAEAGDRVVVFGSFRTVGDILAHLKQVSDRAAAADRRL